MSSPSILSWFRSRFSSTDSTAPTFFWPTDLHSHLLPGLDDGVKTLEESITCIRQLADWGFTKLITTPHIYERFYYNDTATIIASRDALREQIALEQIPVTLDVAAEYMLDEFFLDYLENDELLCFGPDRFVLFETSMLARPLQLEDVVFRIQTRNYTPVLAHPERYSYFYNDIKALERLRDMGCLLQLNCMSLTNRYGPHVRNQAKQLLKNKMIDLVGSDLHRPEDLKSMGKLFTSPLYELLREQPLRNAML